MGIFEIIAIILIAGWILGLIFHIAGGIINILLVVGIALLIVRFLRPKAS